MTTLLFCWLPGSNTMWQMKQINKPFLSLCFSVGKERVPLLRQTELLPLLAMTIVLGLTTAVMVAIRSALFSLGINNQAIVLRVNRGQVTLHGLDKKGEVVDQPLLPETLGQGPHDNLLRHMFNLIVNEGRKLDDRAAFPLQATEVGRRSCVYVDRYFDTILK